MPEAPLVESCVRVAAFLLAVNLAYLRFETFNHRERIKEYVLGKLGTSVNELEGYKDKDYGKRLSYWSALSGDDGAVSARLGHTRWLFYRLVFDLQYDRKAAIGIIWFTLAVFVSGNIVVNGYVQIPITGGFFGIILWLLLASTALSVTLVYYGNSYINKAREQTDDDVKELELSMRDRTKGAGSPPYMRF